MSPFENPNSDLPNFPSKTSVTPTQKPSTTTLESGPNNQPEPFPSALLAAGFGAVVVAVGVTVLIYYKHGNKMKQ